MFYFSSFDRGCSSVSETQGSAWNTAGTFESKSYTPWAIDRISTLLNGKATLLIVFDKKFYCCLGVSLNIPEGEGGGGGVITLKNSSLDGDAEIAINRGKRKHIYDFSATVDWELEMKGDADDIKGG